MAPFFAIFTPFLRPKKPPICVDGLKNCQIRDFLSQKLRSSKSGVNALKHNVMSTILKPACFSEIFVSYFRAVVDEKVGQDFELKPGMVVLPQSV